MREKLQALFSLNHMMWKEHYLLNPQFVWVGEEKTEGAEMVKEMGWRETEGDVRAQREGGKKEKRRGREKPMLRIFCIPWVAKQKSPRRRWG